MKDTTTLIGSPPTVIGVLVVVFTFISSVFFLLILSPVPADVVSRREVLHLAVIVWKECQVIMPFGDVMLVNKAFWIMSQYINVKLLLVL